MISWAELAQHSRAPDPDPLDAGTGGGHGTHVAHIIGGVGGVAPGVSLYAVKVCSSVSTSCSGIALIQGMEFAVDPNGDGKVRTGSTSSTCRWVHTMASRLMTTFPWRWTMPQARHPDGGICRKLVG